ncbi:DUF3598 family protein [Anabaena sp. UHCC 0451]|uniref:DUF3598 family protein n=1 Tax=Anabaena sp. UHCC 0451 TaxID=2055235 RepID=UPI002B21748C|nr:DUF3598 family protein [Anabaena sp. UHCC 0451]MEA5575074.1 DUF3598 family protein [Anabaena sp. UHCC 0451]
MEAQLQNWDFFLKYHVNCDWYGIWSRYSPNGDIIESFEGVRSFHANEDDSEVTHQNYLKYADGKSETKTFGPYQKPTIRALFLDNSFSAGSAIIELGSIFGFETGFRYENKRAEAIAIYNESGNLHKITFIDEKLVTLPKVTTNLPPQEISGNLQGTAKTITSDLQISSPIATSWQPLENLAKDYQILHLSNTVSISCPQIIVGGEEFFYVVDWLVRPSLLLRGIRKYDASGFTSFTLETFDLID